MPFQHMPHNTLTAAFRLFWVRLADSHHFTIISVKNRTTILLISDGSQTYRVILTVFRK